MKVYPLRLADGASQGVYKKELVNALIDKGINITDDWGEADIVHLFDTNLLATRFNNFGELLSIITSSTPLVTAGTDFFFAEFPAISQHPKTYYINRFVHRNLFNASDHIITFSESAKNSLSPEVKTSVTIVPHGVKEEYRTPEVKSPKDEHILYVGYGSPRKNPDAITKFARNINFEFYIVGANWKDILPLNVRKQTNIHLPGFVTDERLVQLYQQASLLYLPSYHEGFGLPLVEAMASGTPIVGSDAYAIPEIVDDAGVFAKPDAVEEHIELATRLLTNPEEHEQYANRAYSRAEEFSWERTARETIEVYQRTLSTV